MLVVAAHYLMGLGFSVSYLFNDAYTGLSWWQAILIPSIPLVASLYVGWTAFLRARQADARTAPDGAWVPGDLYRVGLSLIGLFALTQAVPAVLHSVLGMITKSEQPLSGYDGVAELLYDWIWNLGTLAFAVTMLFFPAVWDRFAPPLRTPDRLEPKSVPEPS